MTTRRSFLTLLGGAVGAAWPRPVIGYFNSGTPSTQVKNLAAFHKGLKEAGFVEGQTSQSNIPGAKIISTACRRWQPMSSRASRP